VIEWIFFILAMLLWFWLLPYHWLLTRIVTVVLLRRRSHVLRDLKQRFVILVPAHNEEQGILGTIQSLLQLDYPQGHYEILVIADNCTDQTAVVARGAGVTVLERQDQDKKSKGYALEYALEHLKKRAHVPDAVVVIDADTRVDTHLLQSFSGWLEAGHDWLQAYYTVANPDDSRRTQLMTYAFSLFNGIWLQGQDRLGLGCALRGNGMCFSWRGLNRCPWEAYGLAEDLEFSWHLRTKGEKVRFVADAKVYGDMIDGRPDAQAHQRLRWEHGRKALRQRFQGDIRHISDKPERRFLLNSDLCMPPLSRYLALSLMFTLLSALFVSRAPEYGERAVMVLGLLNFSFFVVFTLYLTSPFWILGLPLRYARALVVAPWYMLWKWQLLLHRTPTSWVRTARKN
jgi:1,2-diacylglycerol 3-beta-glucosyltransferase